MHACVRKAAPGAISLPRSYVLKKALVTISAKPRRGWFNPFIPGFTSAKSQPLVGNHLAEVVKKRIAVLSPSGWVSGGHRTALELAVPNKTGSWGWKNLGNYLVLSDGAAGTRERPWGVSPPPGNTPCPKQTPHRRARSSHRNFGRDGYLDRSTEELGSRSPLPDEHPRLLAARTSVPICLRGTVPAHKLSDNFTGAKRAGIWRGGLDTPQNPFFPSGLADC